MHPPESRSTRVALRVRRGQTVLAENVFGIGEYTIGASGTDFIIPDAGLDSPHTRLRVAKHQLFIEDLGSPSGTFVRSTRIQGPVPVDTPETIHLGSDLFLDASWLPNAEDDEASLPPQAAQMERVWPSALRHSQLEIGKIIGKGGMGLVFEAKEPTLERTVALKVIHTEASEQAMARFLAEARLTGQLEHPNIVPVHQCGINDDGQPYYTMKRVRGLTLQAVITRLREKDSSITRQYPLQELLNVFLRVCDALSFAHSKNIIHRDLKPANVMLGEFGEVLVMDWGIAMRVDGAEHSSSDPPSAFNPQSSPNLRTIDGTVLGTPNYMAPEQARGERATFATDIYALGALLHSILYLQAPVQGRSVKDIMENARCGRIEATHRDGTPVALAAVARRAMSIEPSNRYASAAELQKEIRAYLNGFATSAEKASPFRLLALALARYRREAIIAAVALATLLTGSALALVKIDAARQRASVALEDLRKSAPVFAAQARALTLEERYAEALEKIDHAIQLHPNDQAYALQRADLLFAQMRFAEAQEAYRAIRNVGRARRSAALCERITFSSAPKSSPPIELLVECYKLMREEQRSAAELLPIAKLLGDEGQVTRQVWVERLRSLPIHPQTPLESRLSVLPDGSLALDLSGSGISDLSPLSGMPLVRLDLQGCDHVRSIEPLRRMPLRYLDLSDTDVSDLNPVAGAPLESLLLVRTPVTDLSPLSGAPLRTLDCTHSGVADLQSLVRSPLQWLILDGCRVRDLTGVEKLPLRTLSMAGSWGATNLALLQEIPTLERLILSRDLHAAPAAEIEAILALKAHPSLQWIDAAPAEGNRPESAMSATAFWTKWEQPLNWLLALKRRGLNANMVQRHDGRWEVDLQGQPLTDLSALAGVPIARLCLLNTPVHDISPLRGMPLEELDLRRTRVSDLSPIAGMPLRRLLLWQTPVVDFSVIRELHALELLDVSQTAFSDLSLLHAPGLRELRMGNTNVTDLSPLAGSDLEKLHCDHVPVTDATPLLQCLKLKWFIPPEGDFDPSPLRNLPSLERISYTWGDESIPTLSAGEFWREQHIRAASAEK